ncbi:MAG: leucyl aminopeptidase [Candidatus Accumulibacter sp.]|jgi:leucyl aminopeptidase|nr:leucyl aminopeptidase [Accumulibacter sp.]
MEFNIKRQGTDKRGGGCIAVGVFEPGRLAFPNEFSEAARRFVDRVLAGGDMDGKAETCLMLHNVPDFEAERLLLVGLGKEAEFDERAYGAAIRRAVKAILASGAASAALALPRLALRRRGGAWRLRQAALIAQESLYRHDRFKSEKEAPRPLAELVFEIDGKMRIGFDAAERAMLQGQTIGKAAEYARALGDLPGNVCTPEYLAVEARRLAGECGFECEIVERAGMEELGMNALLAVAQGSRREPKLIVAHYRRGGAGDKPVVLIGKGVTFDSGGISIKPAEGMDEMKFDMCGAAAVLGALKAAASLYLPINVTAIVPCVENMPGGAAGRPGDIVVSLSGKSVEILNTDAEGRLILCDALTYAERFEPAAVIDVATLTGACVVALGHVATGLFSNDESLALALLDAGKLALDPIWRMPLWDDYRDALKSRFADLANVGGRPAGAITAACFLSRFAEKFPWAHLDIAGTAWKTGAEKGATGRPVPLLAHYLLSHAGKPL